MLATISHWSYQTKLRWQQQNYYEFVKGRMLLLFSQKSYSSIRISVWNAYIMSDLAAAWHSCMFVDRAYCQTAGVNTVLAASVNWSWCHIISGKLTESITCHWRWAVVFLTFPSASCFPHDIIFNKCCSWVEKLIGFDRILQSRLHSATLT